MNINAYKNAINNINAFVSLNKKNTSLNNDEVQHCATSIIENLNQIKTSPNKELKPTQFVLLGVMLKNLHHIKSSEQFPQVNQIYKAIFEIVERDDNFRGILENNEGNVSLIQKMFNGLLSLVEKDVSEEVIGQERPSGGLMRQLISEGVKNKSKIIKITSVAEKLYPLVILSATLHSKAKVPSEEMESKVLENDVMTFMRECNSQFGVNEERDEWLTNKDFFKNCLKAVWHYKRK